MSNFHKKPNIYVTEIVLRVENLNRSVEFYKTIMGFKVLVEKDKEVILTADGTKPIVTLIQPRDIIPKIPRRTGLYHFAVLLPDRLQLGLFLKNIREHKYPLVGGSNHGVSEAIYLEDPDQNGIEVYTDTPEDRWKPDGENIDMVTEILDYDSLLESTGDKQWNKAPNDTIIGHIHLHVADLDEAYKFYKALGFEITQKIKNHAYFISTGGYHHHIGLNIWNGKGAAPLPKNSAGMEYYTIAFPDKGILDKALNDLRTLGFEIVEDEDSIFIHDPSNNLIKLKL